MQIRHDPASDDYHASDLKSANGTRVNGQAISGELVLKEGDRIEIGNSRMVFTRKKFKDHNSALLHFRRQGEHIRGTMVQGPGS
jgi:pSer/pThr/pTyr-binding forkhead associated (FHA) protein